MTYGFEDIAVNRMLGLNQSKAPVFGGRRERQENIAWSMMFSHGSLFSNAKKHSA